jgi:hypothetical protein
VRNDLKDSENTEEDHVKQFDKRSRELLAELSRKEYDIEVSMVPYDVERSGGDRMSRRSSTTAPGSPSTSARKSSGRDGRSTIRVGAS